MAIIRQDVSYDDCYKGISSEFIHNMMNWNKGKRTIGNHIKFRLGQYDHKVVEMLCGIFNQSVYSFVQSVIGIGLVGLSSKYEELGTFSKMLETIRFEPEKAMGEIQYYMGEIIKSGNTKELDLVLDMYCHNKYLEKSINNQQKIGNLYIRKKLPDELLKHIRKYTSKEIGSELFDRKLIKSDEACLIETRIPDRVKWAANKLCMIMHNDYPNGKIYEVCLVVGINIICKKIIEDEKITQCDEYELIKFLSELIRIYTNCVQTDNGTKARIENYFSNRKKSYEENQQYEQA